MKTLGVIPARMGSRRFPGKPLAVLRGRPLIQHVWEAARQVRSLTRLVVATDGEEIAGAVRAFGGEAVVTSGNHATGTDRVHEAAGKLGEEFDVVVNVQGDEPLLSPAAVEAAILALERNTGADITTLACRDTDRGAFASREVAKVVTDRSGFALYFSRAPLADPVAGAERGWSYLRHVGLYAFRTPALEKFVSWEMTPLERAEGLEQLRALEHGLRIHVVVTPFRSHSVDTPGDLESLERDWERLVSASTGTVNPTQLGGVS
jgi:3-deoxy-manno-octulosonate cytidylyltransferase (CMP-KDO synthetase)